MTVAELQKEVGHLPEEQQDILAAYLTMLRRSRDPEWEDTLARRIDDQDRNNWLGLEEFEND